MEWKSILPHLQLQRKTNTPCISIFVTELPRNKLHVTALWKNYFFFLNKVALQIFVV